MNYSVNNTPRPDNKGIRNLMYSMSTDHAKVYRPKHKIHVAKCMLSNITSSDAVNQML